MARAGGGLLANLWLPPPLPLFDQDAEAVARAAMNELEFPPRLVEYAMEERARLRPGGAPTSSFSEWWAALQHMFLLRVCN